MSNRLSKENSPYLLQHANNPVDWYPWSNEAFDLARDHDKPILLSVGYSSCHWCHVMEKESFSDPHIATKMNDLFVNIKVDREERPDVDNLYMQALQAMTGQGGWPMTMFLTPDGKPFFGGTYYPPQDFHDMPSFERILDAVANAYRDQINEIHVASAEVIRRIQEMSHAAPHDQEIDANVTEASLTAFEAAFDPNHGGFGGAPKFPQPLVLEFLLRQYISSGNPRALEMVTTTLTALSRGGIRDHLAGGFHRYTTDSFWTVPHFEKMLYDNALLTSVYLHAFQITGDRDYRVVVEDTIDYVLREMTSESGGFYSSQDADTEGSEGLTYVWTKEQIQSIFDPTAADMICQHYGITDDGNFEHSNVLSARNEPDPTIAEQLVKAKLTLLEARERRPQPFKDTKIIASWNGLMLRSLTDAAVTLDRSDYLEAAVKNADYLYNTLMVDGRLARSAYQNSASPIKGYLEDYASLGLAFGTLYEATLDPKWLTVSCELTNELHRLFWDDSSQLLYDTGVDQDALLVRPRDIIDNAMPCGNSMATELLLRISALDNDTGLRAMAASLIQTVLPLIMRAPTGFGNWLSAVNRYLAKPTEIVLVGETRKDVMSFSKIIADQYSPNVVVIARLKSIGESLPNLAIFQTDIPPYAPPVALVCTAFSCSPPLLSPEELKHQMIGQSL